MIYSIVSIIVLIILCGLYLGYAIKFFTLKRAERISFIKTFKNGKGYIIYLAAYPLCFAAELYAGTPSLEAFFNAVKSSVDLVVAKFDFSTPLFNENPIYKCVVFVCLILVTLNAVVLTASIFYQSVANFFGTVKFNFDKDTKCIIIGCNENSKAIYQSCADKAVIVGIFSKEEKDQMFVQKITYKSLPNEKRLYLWLDEKIDYLAKKYRGSHSKLNIIVNTQNDTKNLDLCGRFVSFISTRNQETYDNVDLYVFGNREFEDVYSRYENQSKGTLHYVNEHRQIAVDFIDNHPMTEFMNDKHIDYATSLLYPDVEINVAIVGFGRVNQQILKTSVANNQFLTKNIDGVLAPKRVNYYLYDKNQSGEHKNLNHTYYRYEHEFFNKNSEITVRQDDYLPLPPLPAFTEYKKSNINSLDFYDDVKSVLKNRERTLNFVVVALGDDYQNVDVANKLVAKIKEWNLNNCKIAVRIRDDEIFGKINLCADSEICTPFGNQLKVVYDYAHVVNEKFTEMAILRNFGYDVEKNMSKTLVGEEEKRKSRALWHLKRTLTEKESNVYACLSLRLKLNLMGLDYVNKDAKIKGITYDEYMKIYAENDLPDVYQTQGADDCLAIKYPLNFKDSRRKNLAVLEHYRWNSFMLTSGFVPSSIEMIKTEKVDGKYTNGKNYQIRRHGNLTTFDGLVEFRKIIAERDNCDEKSVDVIKYDYQILDGAYQSLTASGYKIVKII